LKTVDTKTAQTSQEKKFDENQDGERAQKSKDNKTNKRGGDKKKKESEEGDQYVKKN